jgi:hypothetical protein
MTIDPDEWAAIAEARGELNERTKRIRAERGLPAPVPLVGDDPELRQSAAGWEALIAPGERSFLKSRHSPELIPEIANVRHG